LTTAGGERTVLVYRGASSYFNEVMIPKEELETKWIFITSLAGNIELLRVLIEWSERHGIKTAFIPGSMELEKGKEVLAPILSSADVVVMNQEEAASLVGLPFEEKEKVVREICLLPRGVTVITDAASGATACDREYFYHIGTHQNRAVERTGAGDAFASGFVAGLIKSSNIEDALELAAGNASNVVNYFGAKKGILHAGEKPFSNKLQITKQKV
jgi:ribokinase